MHLEIIFKDPNRKKIFLSKTKTLCAVILSYHLLTWFTGCPFRFRNPLKTILSSFKHKTSGIDFSVIFTEIHPGSF